METKKSSNKFLGAGVISAIAASLCCITPVLALISGASGIASAFSWLEPLRPYLIGITVLVLGFAWYQKLKPKKEIECDCETDEKSSFWQSKLFLGIITVFAAFMLAFPYYSEIFYSDNKKETIVANANNIKELDVDIEGMTCESCNLHVEHEIFELPGIVDAKADYSTGKAMVKFDISKVNQDSIVAAINKTGYKVQNYNIKK